MQFGNKKRKRTSKIGKKKAKKINGKDVNHHMAVKKQIATGSGQGTPVTMHMPVPPIRLDAYEPDIIDELLAEEKQLWEASENLLVVNEVKLQDIFKDPEMARRIQIAGTFTQKYGAKPDCKEQPWYGENGVIACLREDCGLSERCAIAYVLESVIDVRKKRMMGETDVFYKARQLGGTGRKPKLETDSVEAQIVADELESGCSQRIAWHSVNVYREQVGLEPVAFNSVYTLIKGMQPNVVKVNKRRQGSNDETSNICRARKAWCMQLAIRMGLVDYRDVMREGGIPDDVPVPKWFDKEKLTPLKLEQIVFFDEMH